MSGDQVEDALEKEETLDPPGSAVRCEDVRHAGVPQVMRGHGARQVAAGVQVRHVEGAGVAPQKGVETKRPERLVPVGQAIRHIRKHPQVDAIVGANGEPWAETHGGRPLGAQARGGIAHVGRTEGHVMTPPREPARQRAGEPRDAAVRPGLAGIGSDVEDSQRASPGEQLDMGDGPTRSKISHPPCRSSDR